MSKEPDILDAVPFFGVHDIAASVRFYVALGFAKTIEWVPDGRLRWCRVERDGVAVMLQEFWREGQHANVPQEKLGVGVSVCFQCRDAIALFHEFRSRGLEPSVPFVGNGMWVTSVTDPDGYRLFFESVTDAPEESVYSV